MSTDNVNIPTFESERERIRALVKQHPMIRQWLVDSIDAFPRLIEDYESDKLAFERECRVAARSVLKEGFIWQPGVSRGELYEKVWFIAVWPIRVHNVMFCGKPRQEPRVRMRLPARYSFTSHATRGMNVVHPHYGPENTDRPPSQRLQRRAAKFMVDKFDRYETYLDWKERAKNEPGAPETDFCSQPDIHELLKRGNCWTGNAHVYVLPPRSKPIDPRFWCDSDESLVNFQRLSANVKFIVMCYWLSELHDRDNPNPIFAHSTVRFGKVLPLGDENKPVREEFDLHRWPASAYRQWMREIEERAKSSTPPIFDQSQVIAQLVSTVEAIASKASSGEMVSQSRTDLPGRLFQAGSAFQLKTRFAIHNNECVAEWTDKHKADWSWMRWSCAWDDRVPPGATIPCRPPSWKEDDKIVCDPNSAFAKPWGWYREDECDGERGCVVFQGKPDARERYRQLAGEAWRTLLTLKLPEQLSAISEKTRRFVQPHTGDNSEMMKWTLTIYAAAWAGLLPPSVAARRMTWIPGVPNMMFNAQDSPESLQRQVEANRWMVDQLLPKGTVIEPARWRHFCSDLEPNIFEVSGMLLEFVGYRISASDSITTLANVETSAVEAQGIFEDTPQSLTRKQTQVLLTMARFDRRTLLSVTMIVAEMDAATRLGEETVRLSVAKLIELKLAERPQGYRSGVRLNNEGFRLAGKIGD